MKYKTQTAQVRVAKEHMFGGTSDNHEVENFLGFENAGGLDKLHIDSSHLADDEGSACDHGGTLNRIDVEDVKDLGAG